jgi:hypothetical protein
VRRRRGAVPGGRRSRSRLGLKEGWHRRGAPGVEGFQGWRETSGGWWCGRTMRAPP